MLSDVAKTWKGWLVPAALVGVSAVAACPFTVRTPEGVATTGKRCPEHNIAINVDSTEVITDIPLASSIDEIPEFHDCQRFATTTTRNGYGPLVAIWAVETLETVF